MMDQERRSSKGDLRRKILSTNTFGNTCNGRSSAQAGASLGGSQRRHHTTIGSKRCGDGTLLKIYLSSFLETWAGEPEDLFNVRKWRKWLKEEKSKVLQDRFMNGKAQEAYASALVDLLTDDKEPFLRRIQEKLDKEKVQRFMQEKKRYEDQETEKLLKIYLNRTSNGTDEDDFMDFENTWQDEDDQSRKENIGLDESTCKFDEDDQSQKENIGLDENTCKFDEDNQSEKENIRLDENEIIQSRSSRGSEIVTEYPKPPSAPHLTLDMVEDIRLALEKPPKEKLVSGFSLNIMQQDLLILNNTTEWLIDLNMDFYLELIKERSNGSEYPKVYIFHSFFYTLLTKGEAGYSAVQEATGEDNIFKYDIIFFPVNLRQHWRLVVVKFPEKTIRCFDSMNHDDDNFGILMQIGRYLRSEYRKKYCSNPEVVVNGGVENKLCLTISEEPNEMPSMRSFFRKGDWHVANVENESIPQQTNAIDCGIFCLQYAEYISRQQDFDFDQSHIPYFRKRMVYETLTKKLLTSR